MLFSWSARLHPVTAATLSDVAFGVSRQHTGSILSLHQLYVYIQYRKSRIIKSHFLNNTSVCCAISIVHVWYVSREKEKK